MRSRVVVLALFVSACRSPSVGPASGEADAVAGTAGDGDASGMPPSRSPLAAEWMERIDLPSGGVTYVAPPVGSIEPRPIVVAVHGASDDPGLVCSAWRLITDVYPFVVCPGGSKLGPGRHVWPSSDAIEKRIDEALAAVGERYGERIAPGPLVYAAFSQGANLAGPVLAKRRFARAVLTEGGYQAFASSVDARAFAGAGGERVLFTCSQPGCGDSFERSRTPLVRAGVDVRVSYSGPHGHSMPPPVRESIHASLPWIVEGLPGWTTYASAPKLPTH